MNQEVTYHLEPGYVYASAKGAVVRTVVGSCVAVCLWDEMKMVGGMNHFIHPHTKEGDERTTSFGNVALPVLVRMMYREFGCRRKNLHAQIFGGGSPMRISTSSVGIDNVSVARRFFADLDIRVVSEDVGGNMGRKILFDTATGQSVVLKVRQLREGDWVNLLPDNHGRRAE